MRGFAFGAVFVVLTAGAAAAQDTPLSPLAQAVICAPRPSLDGAPADALRIIGAQDPSPRSLFGNRDLLVIGGGTTAGVELGQQFFVRHALVDSSNGASRGATTVGTIRIVAVNDSTAIGMVDRVCNGIVVGDHLERYVEPVVSADLDRDDTPGQPDFSNLGHIVAGRDDRVTVGIGDFALIDWGEAQGLTPGTRFAIFRDVGTGGGVPLSSIGEGVVISTSHAMALTRVTRARDAVYAGDYIALRK